MSLNEEQRRELVQLRLDNADSTIDDAQMLLDNDSVRSAMNRTYYAMFYAVSALAVAHGKYFNKHRQLLAYFHKEYAQTEVFERKHGRALQKAFEDRSEADYQDYIHITRDQTQTRIKEARELIRAIKTYLRIKD